MAAEQMQIVASLLPQLVEAPKKNRIQVSNTKKPLFFYYNEVELSSLGMAITTVITIAEDLLKDMNLSLSFWLWIWVDVRTVKPFVDHHWLKSGKTRTKSDQERKTEDEETENWWLFVQDCKSWELFRL
ncbi:hypothetical protein D8674_005539 [Pyrus ussuriensis x Pyrus communis]|uniref:Uncharacterized protein n=1 Tax=Pyrus ussuriensis x Pyrus communis TaxID=2448454 RepID=A0A5N5FXF3_9ROSA|nr:hypothetical protein D8674_005539 [Pyrus ussuriensis x Pyrus communis]